LLVSRERQGRAGLLLAILCILLTGTALSEGMDASGAGGARVSVKPSSTGALTPGTYATIACEIYSYASEPLSLQVLIDTPATWVPVQAERAVELAPHAKAVVPFSVWISRQEAAGIPHGCGFLVLDARGSVLARYRAEVLVAERHHIVLAAADARRDGWPGRRVQRVFRLLNDGNGTAVIALSAQSVPDWPVELAQSRLRLAPGESRDVLVTLAIPERAAAGTVHGLELTATVQGVQPRSGETLVLARSITDVRVVQPRAARYRMLPARVGLSVERTQDEDWLYGFQFSSEGMISSGTEMSLMLDLLSGARTQADRGWRRDRWLLGLRRDSWEAEIGDVQIGFSGLAARTLWGRGVNCRYEGDRWSLGAYLARDRVSDAHHSLAITGESEVRPALWLRGDYILRRISTTASGPEHSLNLASAGASYAPFARWRFGLEGSSSFARVSSQSRTGVATQVTAEGGWKDVSGSFRGFSGSREYDGWNGDRDGLLSYLRYSPAMRLGDREVARPLSLWLAVDAYRGRMAGSLGEDKRRNEHYQIGSHLTQPGWPSLEFSAERQVESGSDASAWKHGRDDAGLTLWQNFGRVMLSASGRWGRVEDLRTGEHGDLQSHGIGATTTLDGVGIALRWDRDRQWRPEVAQSTRNTTRQVGLTWASWDRSVRIGVNASWRTYALSGSNESGDDEWLVRPRIDWQALRVLSFSLDLTARAIEGPLETETLRLAMTWSPTRLIPILWEPECARLSGRVFLDEDLDGRLSAQESAVPGVNVLLDADEQKSRGDGSFDFPWLPAGTHWLDLDRGSLPARLVAVGQLPMDIELATGDECELSIPLVQCAALSGLLFHDVDYDCVSDHGERGLAGAAVSVWQGENRVATALTDEQGQYRFAVLAPGTYTLRPESETLPAGWVATSASDQSAELRPGARVVSEPLGVAPRRKPIVWTFHAEAPVPETQQRTLATLIRVAMAL
jgi:hypothetical protein